MGYINNIFKRLSSLNNKNNQKMIVAFFCIFLLAYLPILRANYNYIDDMARARFGFRNWIDFGRYINEYLSIVIHADILLNDISPLPQLIAIFILALVCTIIIRIFMPQPQFSWIHIFCALPICLSPYFLECISFKFDALYMSLSLLFGVLPLLFISSNKVHYYLMIIICTIGMCTTYQASSGIFMLLVVFYSAVEWNNGKELALTILSVLWSFGFYLFGLIIFKFLIWRDNTIYHYVDSHISNNIVQTTFDNLLVYTDILLKDINIQWKIVVFAIVFSFLTSFVLSSKKKKYKSFIIALLVLIIGYILSYGAYLIVVKPSVFPRTMIGLGVYLALLEITTIGLPKRIMLASISGMVCAWMLFTFSLAYGNALAEQQRYDEYRINMIVNDLNKLPNFNNDNLREISFHGSIGHSPVVKRMIKRYGVLGRLVPIRMQEGLFYGETYILMHYNLPGWKYSDFDDKSIIPANYTSIPIFIETAFHTIRADQENIVIIVK